MVFLNVYLKIISKVCDCWTCDVVLPHLPYSTRAVATDPNQLQGILSGDETDVMLPGSLSPDDQVNCFDCL